MSAAEKCENAWCVCVLRSRISRPFPLSMCVAVLGAVYAKCSIFKPKIIIHRKLSIAALLLDSVFRYHLRLLLTSSKTVSVVDDVEEDEEDEEDANVERQRRRRQSCAQIFIYLVVFCSAFFRAAASAAGGGAASYTHYTHSFKLNGKNIHSEPWIFGCAKNWWVCTSFGLFFSSFRWLSRLYETTKYILWL